MSAINKAAFFNRLRTYNLYSKMNQGQVDGMNAILTEWEANINYKDIRWLAYILATVYHETDKTMQPIEEYGKGAGKPYGKTLKYGGGPNKRVPYTKPDKLYYGRGHTQNTWYEIYEKLTRTSRAKAEGWDFLNKPETMLQMAPSIWATFHSMTLGLYTGKKLVDYFNQDKSDPLNARRIVNGIDKAGTIALYYDKFLKCLF